MKLKYTLEFIDMNEEIIAVPVGEGANQLHGVVKMNKEGREIIELLENGNPTESIISILSKKYDNDQQQLSKYVYQTIDTLRNENLLID